MTKEVKIGLIGIAALAMLIYGINYLKGINMFQSANYYYVEYTNINGLAGSSPVFANGFKVGTVRSINYNYKKPGHVTVEVEVDKEMRIPKGSKGELVTEMLGTVKMNLLLNDKTNEFFQPGDGFAHVHHRVGQPRGVAEEGVQHKAAQNGQPGHTSASLMYCTVFTRCSTRLSAQSAASSTKPPALGPHHS